MMKKKLFSNLLLYLSLLLGAFLCLAILSIGLMQTPWAQDILKKQIVLEMKKQGHDLDVQGFEGTFPLRWSIQKVSFHPKEGTQFEVTDLYIKVAFLPLMKKNLTIKYIWAKDISVFLPSSEDTEEFSWKDFHATDFTVPFDFNAKTVRIKDLYIKNPINDKTLHFTLRGRAKIYPNLKEANVKLFLKEVPTGNTLKISAQSYPKTKPLEASLNLQADDSQNITSFFDIPFSPSLDFTCSLRGGHSYFEKKTPLSFQSNLEIHSLNLPSAPCLTAPLSLQTKGLISVNPSVPYLISCQECQILSDQFHALGTFTLSPTLKPLSVDFSCYLGNDSNWQCFLPFKGEVESKIHLEKNHFYSSFSSPSIVFDEETYAPAEFKISATKENEFWTGTSEASFSHPLLSWQESCNFVLDEQKLQLRDVSLSYAKSRIGGEGTYYFENSSYAGSFFIMAEELRSLRHLFPLSEIEGKMGGAFSLEGNLEDLSVNASLLLKGIRYQDCLIDSARIETQIEHLRTTPSGSFSMDCKNIFFRDILLSTVTFSSDPSTSGLQTFRLEINGDWKHQVHLDTYGLWLKEKNSWKVDCHFCEGSILTQSFSLQDPFSFGENKHSFFIDPCLWSIGSGNLSIQFALEGEELSLQGSGKHIPLDLLGMIYPHMAFQGIASFQTKVDAKKNDVTGHFFATLEEADFSHKKIDSSKAKGSLQAHFNPNGVQVYSHFYATKNQFLDWTATLPLDYSYAPLKWTINPSKPLASELTMQGAIEEIFDFVNTASHKITGWITSHLFLSNTLKNPFVSGSLECQQGSYENYFTGTKLKEICGAITASKNTLVLPSLEATDEQDGTLVAEGAMILSPEKHFPFEFNATLKNMHIVRSDLVDSSLGGTVRIIGDQFSATVSGDLSIDKATFKIFDELPYEIPSLPVTFINKPIYLSTPEAQAKDPYPFYLDVQLSAADNVFVKGRGLNSEWHGDVHLLGTITDPAAKGALVLKKGEFAFSGKTFTLMQGKISFSDKPSPSAYLKIGGELNLPSITVLAQMQGPLTSPNLSFQSIPAYPTSSILSLILFDKDISEISALQALQLAQTIVSLSGNGSPGVIEAIRKKIGIDRLNIIGKNGTDEISVQIGWYLNHGITLSLSQSATSSDVTVEVDLKNGFIFQAETQNQEEGKFSLKWNKNY